MSRTVDGEMSHRGARHSQPTERGYGGEVLVARQTRGLGGEPFIGANTTHPAELHAGPDPGELPGLVVSECKERSLELTLFPSIATPTS